MQKSCRQSVYPKLLSMMSKHVWIFWNYGLKLTHNLKRDYGRYNLPKTAAGLLMITKSSVNPLECKGNYRATSNKMKLVHWSLMGGLLHLVQRGGDWAGQQLVQAHRCTKCNSYTHQRPVYQSPWSVALRF